MHEHALARNIVESMVASARKEKVVPGSVKEVVMRVGALEFHSEEAFRQTVEVLARGTVLDGAALNLTVMRATLNCKCGHEGVVGDGDADPHDAVPCAECPVCGAVAPVEGGRGVEGLELALK